MSRIFKFRIWDKGFQKFIEEDYVAIRMDGHLYPEDDDDFIIQQFTGMYDKNNKEIFEGDIIQYNLLLGDAFRETAHIIWYDHSSAQCIGFYLSTTLTSRDYLYPFSKTEFKDCFVIGNIMQNPELFYRKDKNER